MALSRRLGCSSASIKGVPKDPFPKSSEFNADHYATLVALPAPFHKYPEPFLCLVGISRYYTLDEDAYPEFLGDNDEGMDLLAFIRTADPTKVRVAERQRAEDEPRVLESTVGRASGDGQDVDVQPIAVTTHTIIKDVASLQPRRQKKRKTAVTDAGGPSHPPKKLKEDFGALGGISTVNKSMAAVQSLFFGAMLEAEARGEPIPTLPFVTSSVSATPEREDRSPADSALGPNLRTIGAPQRFVISSDYSQHSGANIAKAEVDSIIRSSAPAIATVTIVTAAIDTEAAATRAPVAPYLFGIGSPSTGRSDSVPGGFSDVSGSDFLIGGICTVVDPDFDIQKIFLNAEVRMRAEYNIKEKRKLRAVVDEQAELLKTKDGEIESLKAQLLLKEAEAIRLRAEVFKFESAEQSLRASVKVREHEVADLDAQVHELEISSAGLQEKVAAYEGFINQLEKFQDAKLEQLAVAKCLNSTEYLSALGAVISKAVEKGMQEGLSAGITHGAEGRQLADVAAYNPSAEAEYLSSLQHLQSVKFSLIAELKSNKDASVDTIMNLLRLDDILAERLGLTESQPHVDQLMNIANHVSALRGVFVPLSEPLSAAALEGMECTSGSTPDVAATLSTTLVSVTTSMAISTDDYEVAHAESQGGARVDDETTADDDMNLFVSNADLNISE
uniref:Transposase (Putative), gypsy type n=1 Tax=Tanacetum cinerariifolium TaxID=118510 RepID=A0A6L2M616_TANCI|nr:transposase (putative), gypsy type [Tanacetum cinerariifolium]